MFCTIRLGLVYAFHRLMVRSTKGIEELAIGIVSSACVIGGLQITGIYPDQTLGYIYEPVSPWLAPWTVASGLALLAVCHTLSIIFSPPDEGSKLRTLCVLTQSVLFTYVFLRELSRSEQVTMLLVIYGLIAAQLLWAWVRYLIDREMEHGRAD